MKIERNETLEHGARSGQTQDLSPFIFLDKNGCVSFHMALSLTCQVNALLNLSLGINNDLELKLDGWKGIL